MLLSDRLEVINPGALTLNWTIEKQKILHTSVSANTLLVEPMCNLKKRNNLLLVLVLSASFCQTKILL